MTNREYMIELLQDASFIDDGGASYESIVYYNVNCPYFDGDDRCKCNTEEESREVCFRCKEEWLDSEVDE